MSYRRPTSKERAQEVGELLLGILRGAYPKGMTKAQIYYLVGGKVDNVTLGNILDHLLKLNLIKEISIKEVRGELKPGYVAIM